MSIVLDLLVIAVIFFSAFISYRRGFVLTLLRSVGYFIAFPLSLFLSNLVSPLIWDGIVRGMVISNVASRLPDTSIDSLVGKLPDFLQGFNIKSSELFASLTNVKSPTKEDIATAITDNYISITALSIIGVIMTMVFVIILFIVVMILSRKLKVLNKVPLVGSANKILGGIVGVAQGVIWLCIIALIIHLLISAGIFNFLNTEAVNKTIIFGPFYNLSRAISGL